MSNKDKNDRISNPGYIAKWSNLFVNRWKISILLIIAIIIGGVFSAATLNREGFTEVNIPIGIVSTVMPGATSTDVEKKVTREIEEAVSPLEKVESVESFSSNSFSNVIVEFEFGADVDKKIQELKSAVSTASLPDEAEKPEIKQIAAGGVSMLINLIGDYKRAELNNYAEVVEKRIKDGVTGVGKVNIIGGSDFEIKIKVDLSKMNKQDITFTQIKEAIAAKNISIPGGSIKSEGKDLSIEVSHELNKIEDIKNIVIKQKVETPKVSAPTTSQNVTRQNNKSASSSANQSANQSQSQQTAGSAEPQASAAASQAVSMAQAKPKIKTIRLKDIAKVVRESNDEDVIQRAGYLRDGKAHSANSVTLEVRRKSDADTTVISKEVRDLLKDVFKDSEIPEDLDYEVVFEDANMVKRELGSLFQSGWQGLIIVFIILMIFVSFRSSLIISTVIPLVLLIVLLIFKLFDLTLNIITLFALILTLGIIVDNAIVMVEATLHHLNLGRKKFKAALAAVAEVGPAVFSATLTTIIVFIPMAFIGGVMGEFIKYIPYTVIAAIGASFFIAVTFIPLIAGRFVKPTQKSSEGRIKKEEEIKHWRLIDWYGSFMKKALNKTTFMILIAFVALGLLAFSLWIPATGKVKSVTFPDLDSEYLITKMDFAKGTSTKVQDRVIKEVEDQVVTIPNFINYSFIAPMGAMSGSGSGRTIYVGIGDPRDRDESSFDLAQELREKVKNIKGTAIRIEQESAGPPASEYPIFAQINGDDINKLKKAAIEAGEYLESLNDVSIVKNGIKGETEPQLRIKFDKNKMEDKNILPAQAAATVRGVFSSEEVSKIRPDNASESISLNLVAQKKFKDNQKDLEELKIATLDGKKVELKEVAEVSKVNELATINKYNGKRYINVKANLKEGADLKEIEGKLKDFFSESKLDEFDLNENAISFRGQMKMDMEAMDKILVMLVLALILVYTILVAQFNSFLQPFVIILAVPLALTGVFPGLWATGNVISFMSNVGVVALVGIVVNDAIIYIDYANQLHRKGNGFVESLVLAGQVRFKPILSTSLTTIGGIMPLALTSDFWSPIGTAVMSGLLFSTIGTLIVMPAVYTLLHNFNGVVNRLLGREEVAN
ncbi:MAG: efflux RND transporter permease subunit [Actinobacteria bacterium]|nr:MAG: efflux RND transporter permease subunit [Actinomycetota bacterium]